MAIPDIDFTLADVEIEAVAFDERDEVIVDKIGKAVRQAVKAREDLQNAVAEAIDSSSTFGYELGVLDERHRVLELMRPALCDEENCKKEVCKQYLSVYRKVESGKE
jgi:hypothetical protein